MEKPQNFDLESSLNPETLAEPEPFRFLPLGMILTLISGLIGIFVTALPSEPVNPEPSSTVSNWELFSTPIPTLKSSSHENPNPWMKGNLMSVSDVKSINKIHNLENISFDHPEPFQLNNLESPINILIPDIQALNIEQSESQSALEISEITDISEMNMTPLNLIASRPQYPMVAQPSSEVQSTPSVPDVSEIDGIQLTLQEVIFLALENNRTIKNQYLERIVQRQDLAVAEDKFNPNFTPSLSIGWDNITQGNTTIMNRGLRLSAKVLVKIPTGAELNLEWEGQRQQENYQGSGISDRDILRQNLALVFNQPLLRGAGEAVNRASIEIARIQETINLLDLKSILIDKITEVILVYRALLQAQEQVKIETESLKTAQEQVETTKVLIQAGRLPRTELITVQTRVANQELSLLSAQNNLKQQQLNLLQLLDIAQEVNIIASENLDISSITFNPDEIKQLGLENQPSYLQSKLKLQQSKTDLIVAENNRRWKIDLSTRIIHQPAPDIIGNQTDLRAGLVLSKTLGDRTLEQDFQRSRINVLQAENNLIEAAQNLEIDVKKSLQDLDVARKTVELSRQATQLAEQQLQNEVEKVKLGADGSSLVNLVQFQSGLTQAQNSELNAKIDYLNTLTNLYQSLGTTLNQFGITIEQQPIKNND
ncbi:MAG: TolC family protein [Planktothrix sp.]|uniref:TolC family protein n=1 Tax=Planktothrix sp. TaxID=3088171 RepID=UPI0038D49F82